MISIQTLYTLYNFIHNSSIELQREATTNPSEWVWPARAGQAMLRNKTMNSRVVISQLGAPSPDWWPVMLNLPIRPSLGSPHSTDYWDNGSSPHLISPPPPPSPGPIADEGDHYPGDVVPPLPPGDGFLQFSRLIWQWGGITKLGLTTHKNTGLVGTKDLEIARWCCLAVITTSRNIDRHLYSSKSSKPPRATRREERMWGQVWGLGTESRVWEK